MSRFNTQQKMKIKDLFEMKLKKIFLFLNHFCKHIHFHFLQFWSSVLWTGGKKLTEMVLQWPLFFQFHFEYVFKSRYLHIPFAHVKFFSVKSCQECGAKLCFGFGAGYLVSRVFFIGPVTLRLDVSESISIAASLSTRSFSMLCLVYNRVHDMILRFFFE